jgi:CRISPR-associated endonuclease/helicase Cas3/CRISPR-associated endonuclease Cas3-HD
MDLPLISHPDSDGDNADQHPDWQLTTSDALRLEAHSEVVARRAIRSFDAAEERATVVRSAAYLHDFGKSTPQFQAYIKPEEQYDGPEEQRYHARLGAMATWFGLKEMGASERDCLAATLAVARHHQALPNAASYTAQALAEAFTGTAIQSQVGAINEQWPEAADSLLQAATDGTVGWDGFETWATSGAPGKELQQVSARDELTGPTPTADKLPSRLYDRTLRYWSAITLADKTHAMGIPESHVFDFDTLDRETIETYVQMLRAGTPSTELEATLNDDRERARRQAVAGVHEWLRDGGENSIATLTLPTGLGKTFTGLSAAFEARDIHAEAGGETRPIIYALPYTSIIEQTRELFENPDLWGADPKRSALTVHHYLSETVVHHDEYSEDEVEDTDAEDRARLLGEAWRDGTILTTFVQLFESLTGPTNRQGLKLPALAEAVVILDEPQSLPKDWWDAIPRLFDTLRTEYDPRIIAMTATQPTLLRDLDTRSLLEAGRTHDATTCEHCRTGPSYETQLEPVPEAEYYDRAERVQYSLDPSSVSFQLSQPERFVGHEAAADRLVDETRTGGSTLAVCNTIDSSRVLSAAVTSHAGVTHLGSNLERAIHDLDVDGSDQVASEHLVDHVLESVGLDPTALREAKPTDEFVSETVYALTLNSRYRPIDRQFIIALGDVLSTAPIPFVLLSTQAIEAGVDLSFRAVYRDLAPLDSVVQAAGRCNRSYEWGRNGGDVTVWTLAATDEETPSNPTKRPPAYYVYERGTTDAGIPGHLELISSVLGSIDATDSISDVRFSRDAVDQYFDTLGDKSLASTEIRRKIDRFDGPWLGRQSLIGGYETVDVLVPVTQDEVELVDQLHEQLADGVPEAYDTLAELSNLRVSLPRRIIEEAPNVPRLDGKKRGSDGVNVFWYLNESGLSYDIDGGGLQSVQTGVGSRFTI